MNWTIRNIMPRFKNEYWRQQFAVFVDEKQMVQFGQLFDGRWQINQGDHFLTRRACRAAALKQAGINAEVKVPAVFYADRDS